MKSASFSEFRARQSDFIAAAQREPVEITSRGMTRRAVVVSPAFFAQAQEAIELQADLRAAAAAREETTPRVPHAAVLEEFGL